MIKKMARNLKSLTEHNSITTTLYRGFIPQKPTLNGIACPKCGDELLDTEPNVTLSSMPPKKNVGCSNKDCDYVGYRVA